MMTTTVDIDNTPVGQAIEYHVGDLASDRYYNPPLRQMAEYVYAKSTVFEGSGEFELKQVKLSRGVYRYLAKRIKGKSS